MPIAVYAGSFDPVTRGHEDLMWRSLTFVDKLIVAVAVNSAKQPLFSIAERVQMIKDSIGNDPRIEVREFNGLLVDFARDVGATLSIRGLRAVADFEYEYQMALMNRHLQPTIETIFVMPNEQFSYTSSSLVKQVARYGGAVGHFVPPNVAEALRNAFSG